MFDDMSVLRSKHMSPSGQAPQTASSSKPNTPRRSSLAMALKYIRPRVRPMRCLSVMTDTSLSPSVRGGETFIWKCGNAVSTNPVMRSSAAHAGMATSPTTIGRTKHHKTSFIGDSSATEFLHHNLLTPRRSHEDIAIITISSYLCGDIYLLFLRDERGSIHPPSIDYY